MDTHFSTQDEFMDDLLLKHRISLRVLSDFAENHIEELKHAEDIFDLRDEHDEKLCLSVFCLMAGENAPAVRNNFCNRYQINDSSVDEIFFERNKLFLIAAFAYNPVFFAMCWNLCGIIASQLAMEAESQNETITPKKNKSVNLFFQRRVEVPAASGADEALREIWAESIDLDGVQGNLRIRANNRDDAGEMEFRFRFSEYHGEPLYFLKVHFTAKSDESRHIAELNKIAVNSKRKKELIIASSVQSGIHYSEGFTITSIEVEKFA